MTARFVVCLLLLSSLTGCSTSKREVNKALSLYKQCIDSGRSAADCEQYWAKRDAALEGAGKRQGSDGARTLGTAIIMGVICGATSDPTSCMAGATESMT